MILIPLQLIRPRFSVKTMFIGVAATASIVALFSRISRPPEQAAFGLLLGIVLPTIWVGAWRRFTVDRLFAQMLIVCGLDILLIEPHVGGRAIFLSVVAVSLLVPSVGWYGISRMEPGADKDRYRQALVACLVAVGLVALQVAASFIIVSLVVR
jgi:hypothetical protein